MKDSKGHGMSSMNVRLMNECTLNPPLPATLGLVRL